MADLLAALALARKNSETAIPDGNAGNSSNVVLNNSENNQLGKSRTVATPGVPMATVATIDCFDASVATTNTELETTSGYQKAHRQQCLTTVAATAATVATKNIGDEQSPPQVEPFRCWVCHGAQTAKRPLLPIMTDTPGLHRWMHDDECWREHVRQCKAARAGGGSR